MSEKPIIGICIGDVNGVGPEIILKTFADGRILDTCTPVIYGSLDVLMFYKKLLHIPDLAIQKISNVSELKKGKINVIDCLKDKFEVTPGISSDAAGKLAFMAIEMATDDILNGRLNSMLTAPVNKKNIAAHRNDFKGHTGYFAERDGKEALMVLYADNLRISMVTGHVALMDVKKNISTEAVLKKIEALQKCLIRDFKIARPRIAVLGLNPHAGEEGVLGKEEQELIIPAINQSKTKGIIAAGPFPSDGFFGSGNYLKFDGVLAMYHDQALIPFKTLCFDSGVNFTAGLSFVRTSPDHGTAYEIAGERLASETSFRNALYGACDIFKARQSEVPENRLETE